MRWLRRLPALAVCGLMLVAPVGAVLRTHVLPRHIAGPPAASPPPPAAAPVIEAMAPAPRSPAHDQVVVVGPSSIDLVKGPAIVRTLPFPAGTASFDAVVAAVGDPSWLAIVEPGVFLLRAAVVQSPGTDLRFVAPAVRELRLADLPGVYLGGDHAVTVFTGVRIESWSIPAGRPSMVTHPGRPFVLYQDESHVLVQHSEVAFLGSEQEPTVGMAWINQSSVVAMDTTFHDCAVGAYGSGMALLVMHDDIFRHNEGTGLQLRENSRGAWLSNNVVDGNRGDGIDVSGDSTAAEVLGNRVQRNGGDGMVFRLDSDGAVVARNLVSGNGSSGIAVRGASRVGVIANEVTANRMGVQVGGVRARPGGPQPGTAGNILRGNHLDANGVGIVIGDEARDTSMLGNDVHGPGALGLLLAGRGTSIAGGTVGNTRVGIDARAGSSIRHVTITGVARGMVVRRPAVVEAEADDVSAERFGVTVERGAGADLRGGRVAALVAGEGVSRGQTGGADLVAMLPFPWLTVFGGAVLLMALLTEVARRGGARHRGAGAPPAGIWNVS